MKTRTYFFLILVISLFNLTAFGQDEGETTKGFDKSKLFFGGYFGISFGNSTFVNVSPQVGYRFNNWFAAGAGVNFIYSNFLYYDIYGNKDYRYEYGSTGLNIFGRVYPIQFAFLQLQPEINYIWGKEKFYNPAFEYKLDPKFRPTLLAGVGAAIPAGRGAILLMLQYDLIQSENPASPYGRNPFFSMGFTF
ncbi:hypothetical protein [Pollutibacter soli]|uniref:hypothetical protein n=1 Tax=Pollutibacter soli TaxID=3034157 RepID=UPI0030133CED